MRNGHKAAACPYKAQLWLLREPAAAAAKLLQSCRTLCDPIDGSPPGSPVPGIIQARTLEWVAISFSNAWKWKVKVKSLSRVRLFATPWTAAYQAPPSMGFSRQEYWSGLPSPSPEGTRALGKVLFLDCQSGKCQKKHLRLVSHSFFLPYPCPLDKSQFLQHHSRKGAFIHRWGDPKEGGWRWEPQYQETWSPWGFSKLFQPRGSTSFGCSRRSFSAGGPTWIWRLWVAAEGNRLIRAMRQGSLAGTSSPAPSAPWQSILGKQACPGFRDVTAAQVTKAWGE